MKIVNLFKTIVEKTSAGEDTVLTTIISENGSSPRSAGAHMLVNSSGRVTGTIGGGTVEYAAINLSKKLLLTKQSCIKTYTLRPNGTEDLGMLCGGDIEVHFQFLNGGDKKVTDLFSMCIERLETKDETLWFFIDINNNSGFNMAFYGPDCPLKGMEFDISALKTFLRSKPALLKHETRVIYCEPVNFAGKVVIFGAGHIAQALQPLLNKTGFRCVIFDSRKEFLVPQLFPCAFSLTLGDYCSIAEKITINENDYIIVVTHAFDLAVLRQIINRPWAYLGLIGSMNKIIAVKKQLQSEGVPEETLNKMNAPIGLKIRSETSEEIAVSIAAEMILHRAKRRESASLGVVL
ncbi:MAG: XdhC family protein [Spirochaetaceae bacterium]|jgi:xanthine dehydrogenase accessory factor|nr:XdhC family protein [Spirochaetaceae bacterium]GMO29864.1 MAG: XdhC/CoxI family protein [Termitinemataceae bacterium]